MGKKSETINIGKNLPILYKQQIYHPNEYGFALFTSLI